MASLKTYASARAFRTALEERLKRTSITEQTDLNRLRRQVAFDRLLARLFREEPPPWVLKGGYALELRFKAARSTVDIDLTVQWVPASIADDQNQIVRDMLQTAADVPFGDWFECYVRTACHGFDSGAVRRCSLSSRCSNGRADLRPIPLGRRHW